MCVCVVCDGGHSWFIAVTGCSEGPVVTDAAGTDSHLVEAARESYTGGTITCTLYTVHVIIIIIIIIII